MTNWDWQWDRDWKKAHPVGKDERTRYAQDLIAKLEAQPDRRDIWVATGDMFMHAFRNEDGTLEIHDCIVSATAVLYPETL